MRDADQWVLEYMEHADKEDLFVLESIIAAAQREAVEAAVSRTEKWMKAYDGTGECIDDLLQSLRALAPPVRP